MDVDVADITKTKRHPSQQEHHGHANGRNADTAQESTPHKSRAQHKLPADLQMKGKRTNET